MYKQRWDCICSLLLVLGDTCCTEKQWISHSVLLLPRPTRHCPKQGGRITRHGKTTRATTIRNSPRVRIWYQAVFFKMYFIILGSQVILSSLSCNTFRESRCMSVQLVCRWGGCFARDLHASMNIWCDDNTMQSFSFILLCRWPIAEKPV